jgi:outer membrane protein OmpA-like peptidoglycan-associated protein
MKRSAVLLLATALAGCSLFEVKTGPEDDEQHPSEGAAPAATAKAPSVKPGNSILEAAAAPMGKKVSGAIEKGNPSNFYKFTHSGKLRDVFKVRLENTSATLRPDIKLYNSERSQLQERYDGTAGANVETTVSVNPGDTIYVEVLPYNSSGTYDLSVTAIKAFDAHEPNDDQLKPTAMKFDSTVEGGIMDKEDHDWYRVTPATADKVTVTLENLSSTLRPDVKVYSSQRSQIIERYDGTAGAWLDFEVKLEPGQDFYLHVLPYNSTGKYRLSTRPSVGATQMASALDADGAVNLYGIYFDTDQAFVRPESGATLTEVANLLKAQPGLRVEVGGHTDNTGEKAHNMELSKARAEAVVAALVSQHGIDPKRLVAKGYGASKPVADNDSTAGKAKNRRVELRKL